LQAWRRFHLLTCGPAITSINEWSAANSPIGIGGNMTAERYNALVAILRYGDVFEARLLKRFADVVGYGRGLRRSRAAREQSYCD
jgi:hypothetical protein